MVDQPRYRSRFNEPGDDDWSDGRSESRSTRRSEPRLEQRLDQWMATGRQLVDGVAGARPGSRPQARGTGAAAGPRLRPGDLGRWVERKIDWLLEDEDGWREPWQAAPLETERSSPPPPAARRRPLEAMSRRGTPLLPERREQSQEPQAWPDDDDFSLNRWRRPSPSAAAPSIADQSPPAGRAMPRSSRRRFD